MYLQTYLPVDTFRFSNRPRPLYSQGCRFPFRCRISLRKRLSRPRIPDISLPPAKIYKKGITSHFEIIYQFQYRLLNV